MTRTLPPTLIPHSTIMIVGDVPAPEDWAAGTLLSELSHAGRELSNMLRQLGIPRHSVSVTTVCRHPVPGKPEFLYTDKKCTHFGPEILEGIEKLKSEIELVKPTIILALGNMALQALTGKNGITKWRGSVLQTLPEFCSIKCVPTFSPQQILKMWEWRPLALRDMQRMKDESLYPEIRRPEWHFIIRPAFEQVEFVLNDLLRRVESTPTMLSVDIETRGGLMACVGIAWNKTDSICIPLMSVGTQEGYWSAENELYIVGLLQRLLTHPNAVIIGQNFGYDAQYFATQMGFLPIVKLDTMVMQHVYLLGQKRSLDFIASMYCSFYVYWKDDGKEWDSRMPEEQYWIYNCEDTVRTFECAEQLMVNLTHARLDDQYAFIISMWPHVVKTMLRGVRVDEKMKAQLGLELTMFIEETTAEVHHIVGHPINLASPLQLSKLIYDDLQMPVVRDKKTKQRTTNDDALVTWKKKAPELTGLWDRIAMVRSASVLRSTFAGMPLSLDRRMRCYYNLAGTETLRLNSKEDAFGSGGNLQNIPKGDEDKAADKKRALIQAGQRQLIVPNMRKMFIPDPGYTFFDVDLDRADLMVVIWEADDDKLRQAIAEGVDLHTYNASALFGVPEKSVTYAMRQAAKMFAHGTNYGGSARTMAINCGFTVHQSDTMQRRWFAEHPGIKEWHRRTEAQLQATREVRNVFGFRRRYFDRIEGVLPEALAWQPQSVVALVINKGWKRIAEELPEVQVLLQVHDSLAGQFPTHRRNPIMRDMRKCLTVEVPYDKPLFIGVGIAISEKSWGDCEGVDWPEELAA